MKYVLECQRNTGHKNMGYPRSLPKKCGMFGTPLSVWLSRKTAEFYPKVTSDFLIWAVFSVNVVGTIYFKMHPIGVIFFVFGRRLLCPSSYTFRFPEGAKAGVLLSILEKDEWVTYFVETTTFLKKGRCKAFALASLMEMNVRGVRSGGTIPPHPDELDGSQKDGPPLFSYDRSSGSLVS